MKHAGPVALTRIGELLDRIRQRDGLMERKPGIFYRRSRAFLHFHEDPSGIYADLRSENGFERYPAGTAAEWRRLLRRIDSLLATNRMPRRKRGS